METHTHESKLVDASQDDLIAIVDSCERTYESRFHHDASTKEFDFMMQLKQEAIMVLKTKYHLDDQEIKTAWQEWNERTLRQEYAESICAQCLRSPGYENYKNLGGVLSCKSPNGSGSAMIYSLPKTKDRCVWEMK